ncbi:MAG: serine/threonine-protein kinase PknK [Bradymonadia bacterium]
MGEHGFTLGRFELSHLLGKGAMGSVWGGVHMGTGRPVAVKVLHDSALRDQQRISAFKHEIQAVSAVDHPAIIQVFDHGIISKMAAADSEGRLTAGSPYLAMEQAAGGPLSSHCGLLNWAEVQGVLLWLLDALSHAHARGIIHRDLKPSNVLLTQEAPAIRLTDFGLARAVAEVDAGVAAVAGTPGYMAPEQVTGRWRDQGPWTDLYALGALAYHLASGQRPFKGANPRDTMRLQLVVPPPPFEPCCPVPDGFAEWITRLMSRSPQDRFLRAADAAWALWRLDPVAGHRLDTVCIAGQYAGRPPTLYWWAPQVEDDDDITGRITPHHEHTLNDIPGLGTLEISALMSLDGEERPPFPLDWRAVGTGGDLRSMNELGPGFQALRTAPMVGRVEERDRLWGLLQQAVEREEAQVAIIEGLSGVGISRLARWLCELAHEAGVATVLQAFHGPERGPGDGLGPMLVRHLKTSNLTSVALLDRVLSALSDLGVTDPVEGQALADALEPSTSLTADPTLPGSMLDLDQPHSQSDPILKYLLRLSQARPVILWLDDVHWSLDGLHQVAEILRISGSEPMAMMVVLTLRTDGMPEEGPEQSHLAEIAAHARSTRLTLGPLAESELSALLMLHMGIAPRLAQRVTEQTQGSPNFAIQLISNWIERGLLVETLQGFDLAPGVNAELPDDVHALWIQRLDHLLDDPATGQAFEIAATLGLHVDPEEWSTACAHAGLPASLAALHRLITHHLVARNPGGPSARWSFIHGAMRESLLRRARDTGRATAHHIACAAALQRRLGPETAERLGRHLHAGGRPQDAIKPLLRGARIGITRGLYTDAIRLLDLREDALKKLQATGADARWGEGWLVRAEALSRSGYEQAAEGWARLAIEHARLHQWSDLYPSALELSGRLALNRSELDLARELFESAMQYAEHINDDQGVGICQLGIARVCRHQGHLDEVFTFAEQAGARFAQTGDIEKEARTLFILGETALHRGDLEGAIADATRALERYTEVGYGPGIARSEGLLAHVALARGDLSVAEHTYRTAMSTLEHLGRSPSPRLSLGLAQVLTLKGQGILARSMLRPLRDTLEQTGRTLLKLRAEALWLLTTDPTLRDHTWPDQIEALLEKCRRFDGADADLAWMLEHIASDVHGLWPDRARDIATEAASLWQRLGRAADLRRITEAYLT